MECWEYSPRALELHGVNVIELFFSLLTLHINKLECFALKQAFWPRPGVYPSGVPSTVTVASCLYQQTLDLAEFFFASYKRSRFIAVLQQINCKDQSSVFKIIFELAIS